MSRCKISVSLVVVVVFVSGADKIFPKKALRKIYPSKAKTTKPSFTILEDNDPTGYKSNEAKEVKATLKIHPLEFPARRHFRTSGRVCSKDHAMLKTSVCSSPVLANASEDLAPRRCSSIVRTPPVPN